MRDRIGDWQRENDSMHWSFLLWVVALGVIIAVTAWVL